MNALELADYMENDPRWHDASTWEKEAAAELRRLHAINAELVEALQKSMKYVGFAFAKDLLDAEEFGLACEELIKKAKQ